MKFTEVYVLFQSFFLNESQPAGPITNTKEVNVKLRKVRQR